MKGASLSSPLIDENQTAAECVRDSKTREPNKYLILDFDRIERTTPFSKSDIYRMAFFMGYLKPRVDYVHLCTSRNSISSSKHVKKRSRYAYKNFCLAITILDLSRR